VRDGKKDSSVISSGKNMKNRESVPAKKATKKVLKKASKKTAVVRVSPLRRPEGVSLEAWQVALRRQIAGEQGFTVKPIGMDAGVGVGGHIGAEAGVGAGARAGAGGNISAKVGGNFGAGSGGRLGFSEFLVTNPKSGRTYRVAIRGVGLGVNYCSCPDYAVNTLGTCKHIEFLLAKLARKRGGKAALTAGFQPPFSEVYLRYGAKRAVMFRAGTECPWPVRRIAEDYFDDNGELKAKVLNGTSGAGGFHKFLEKVAEYSHEVRCYDDALTFVSRARDDAERRGRIDAAFPAGATDKALSKLLNVDLYPYQRAGALFAAKAGRCLIADDMGLGKTIQAIAAAEILARHADLRRVLVICPTSLKHQWQREIEKFAGRRTVVVQGATDERHRLYAGDDLYTITNYDVLHRDLDAIAKSRYDLIILDEAQRIKNWKTRAAQSVKTLDSEYAIVLTGTPLENRLEELHSIVEFVDRQRLGPMFRFLATHQHVDDSGRVVGYQKLDDIKHTLAPILVRRTKDAVLKELPERLEKRFFVPMTDQQMACHEENREMVAQIVSKWRRYGYLSEMDQRRLTCGLQNMRMSCNSTYLIDKQTDHGHKIDELMMLLEEALEDRDTKVVIFSQWLGTHELIVHRLAERATGRDIGHVLFHGGVPGPKRKELVTRFRDDPACRLFLSTDAGGVGLNLQHASVVINMDLPWNPAVLEQRIGRVHRLGQHRPVRVVNFIAKGTIEEGMLSLLTFKKSMFAGVLDGGKNEVFLGGTRLTQFMNCVEQAAATPPPTMPAENGENDGEAEGAGDAEGKVAAAGETTASADTAAAPAATGAFAPSTSANVNEDVDTMVATTGPQASAAPTNVPTGTPAPAGAADRQQAAAQSLGDLLTAGATFLHELGQSLRQSATVASVVTGETAQGTASTTATALTSLIGTDEATGQRYVKLPLPQNTEPLLRLTELLQAILKR